MISQHKSLHGGQGCFCLFDNEYLKCYQGKFETFVNGSFFCPEPSGPDNNLPVNLWLPPIKYTIKICEFAKSRLNLSVNLARAGDVNSRES